MKSLLRNNSCLLIPIVQVHDVLNDSSNANSEYIHKRLHSNVIHKISNQVEMDILESTSTSTKSTNENYNW